MKEEPYPKTHFTEIQGREIFNSYKIPKGQKDKGPEFEYPGPLFNIWKFEDLSLIFITPFIFLSSSLCIIIFSYSRESFF